LAGTVGAAYDDDHQGGRRPGRVPDGQLRHDLKVALGGEGRADAGPDQGVGITDNDSGANLGHFVPPPSLMAMYSLR
jgi:hypothetical protein